ncbi:MAG: hypothetical protein HYV27_00755 [Candidatus Hydrogenedentes bacterium]|nr:hypothetical protein [Candidatus Hydrogenedentota bacterium]
MKAPRAGRTRTSWSGLTFLLFFISTVSPLWAQNEAFRIRGVGAAEGSNFDVRRSALQAAFQNAIQQVLDVKIAEPDLATNRRILRYAERYIPNYTVVEQSQGAEGVTISIDAEVDQETLEYDISALILPRLTTPPSVQFILAEDHDGTARLATRNSGTAQTIFDAGLENLKVEGHSPEELLDMFSEATLLEAIYGDVAAASQIARAALTDTVVMGRISVSALAASPGSPMLEHTAQAALRVFRTSDGKMLDDITSRAVVLSRPEISGSDQAIEDACKKLIGPTVVAAVMTVVSDQPKDRVIITVETPQSQENWTSIKDALTQDAAVFSVEDLFFTEKRARLRLAYDGPMGHLADLLSGLPVHGGTLTVDRAVGRNMTVSLH